uniref:E3 ubiquitin-protein ligase LRSAM1-like n=1 Tax=Crassostrea virginica TaxID=6565 RepID=A0A8B8CZA0_CRAVI|nr:E3 ubiquitin-protein ligase LRSAM1-like [Crassostrea virginica]XP_022321143.1 E3 ubiquitin-protein ligase LRSAM1-like [Crassostrea virginica]XP_022321144.1 E3 ubiquitin-protein ligase LRSAM1-like [Crassostrea virginica]
MGQNEGKHAAKKNNTPGHSRKVSKASGEGSDSDSVDTTSSSQSPISPSGSKNIMASFFRKQSDACRKRMDHQLYLAQESPEPTIDLSKCELEEIPPIVFSLCKILSKEAVFLGDNWLSSMSGGKCIDLRTVRVLDLHSNEIKVLPSDIGNMTCLQILNLEGNKLSILPTSIENLKHLQTLNLKGNKLKHVSPSLCGLKSLRLLDLSENRITTLPSQLCNVRTLESLVIDVEKITFPPHDICKHGTGKIMQYLCSECNMEYEPPSKFLSDILEPPNLLQTPKETHFSRAGEKAESALQKSIDSYNSIMDKKRQERIELERLFELEMLEQAQLASQAMEEKQRFIDAMAQDQTKIDKELETILHGRGQERKKLVEYMQQVENSTDDLIKNMLEMQEKARRTEELLELMEKERIEEEELFVVRSEELQNLRKQEVLRAMESVLQESDMFECLRSNYVNNKDQVLRQALHDEEISSQGQVASILNHKDLALTNMLDVLQKQEEFQKDAFEALQLQKDAKTQRIFQQINMIEEELASLTLVELQRKEERTDDEINRLAEKRIELLGLLSQLMSEQESRREELRKRLSEMEQQKEDGQTDYWLVQYQRLMDRKPQALMNQEHRLEIAVVTVLKDSGAEDYLPLFARHRITIETLLQMTDADLKQMGIHEVGIRKSILKNSQNFRTSTAALFTENEKPGPSPPVFNKFKDRPNVTFDHPLPSAPLARQDSILARGLNSECVICLDRQSAVIFLSCGHVCCCEECSAPLKDCPLCRGAIVQRIKLNSAVGQPTEPPSGAPLPEPAEHPPPAPLYS